ncbi:MAG: glycoside hydrolase family 127 protein [Clostridia bacterium]|nr:glycoside hydrolase family 127 protein [Clostridia bacterium]
MFAEKIANYFNQNPQYKTALSTDVFIPYRVESRSLTGLVDKTARFIEEIQLLDAEKWALFVSQFRTQCVDSANEGWRGEYWGKMMRGACITYGYTKNPKLYDVLTKTVEDILETKDKLGRISTYSVDKQYCGWDIWCRKYIILGLLHYHEICKDNLLKNRIISTLEAHLDYMVDTLGDGKLPINETSVNWGAANSVSLLEPVMRMYNHTGNARYLEFADYIVKTGPKGLNIFEEAFKEETAPFEWSIQKAYELMSCFEGLVEYYRVTGNTKWKRAAVSFAKKVIATDVSIIGCCGCDYECFDNCNATQTDPANTKLMQETCVTVTWIKFCYQLLRLTGDVAFADEIEKSVYNALYGAVNTEQCKLNGGFPFDSYSPLILNTRGRGIGGLQYDNEGNIIYGCCTAIGAAGTGIVPEISASITENGVVFNMYVNGVYNLVTPQNNSLEINVSTNYPLDGSVEITVSPEKEQEFEIMLRIPEFSKQTAVAVNGEAVAVQGRYLRLNRLWRRGDKIALNIDMAPRVIHPIGCENPDSLNYIAVKYGPLVLARDARLCGDIGKSVDLDFDKDGSIKLEKISTADFPTLCEFKVPCKNGEFIKMTDYQSAGKTWDTASATEAWMPIKQ